ncbi:g2423 [Coccomyxa elongata]
MTGFSNLLRKIFCLPPKQDLWEEARKSRVSLLTPARIKVAVRNERQIEYKIDYLVSPGLAKQIYDVRLYLFFSTELDAAETSFYRSLYSAVRLHTPKTNVRELSANNGASSIIGAIAATIQVVKAKLASGGDVDTDATHLVYQLQLYACTFRRAIRRTVKHILAKLLDSTDILPSEAAECRAAADICELLDASTAAVQMLQKVCWDCEDAKMPDWLRDAWHLVEESVLLEEHIALLKLGVKLEALDRAPSENLDRSPSQASLDCHIGSSASPEKDSKQPGSSGSLLSGRPHQSFDIEEGGGGPPMNSPEPEQAAETDEHTGQWHLSAESRGSSARGITSLVFVNPRALYLALNRYSMAMTDKLASTLQHSLSTAGYHPVPPSSNVHQAADAGGSPQEEGGSSQMPRSRRLLASARRLLLGHVQAVEALARERGYTESLLQYGNPTENEQYTNRVKILKRHAQLAITLAPRMLRRSMLVDDIVGMTIAGVAMAFALTTMYWAFRSSAQYGILYIAIYIIGYMFKDRIKEWGKRYLQPIAEWFGIYFPDRVQKFRDYFGNAVGSCSERVRIKDGLDVSARVLAMRYAGHKSGPPSKKHMVKPERVLVYTKKMEVRWRALEVDLQGVRSLDDVIRIDLDFLLRAMQPPHEIHYALVTDSTGALGVNEVQTARVYHVNSVLELRTQGPNPEKAMQLEKMRIVMDRSGIKRLEACEDNALLAKAKRAPLPHIGHR